MQGLAGFCFDENQLSPIEGSCQDWPWRVCMDKVRGSRISGAPKFGKVFFNFEYYAHQGGSWQPINSCPNSFSGCIMIHSPIKTETKMKRFKAPSFCLVLTTKTCLQFRMRTHNQTLITLRVRTRLLSTTWGADFKKCRDTLIPSTVFRQSKSPCSFRWSLGIFKTYSPNPHIFFALNQWLQGCFLSWQISWSNIELWFFIQGCPQSHKLLDFFAAQEILLFKCVAPLYEWAVNSKYRPSESILLCKTKNYRQKHKPSEPRLTDFNQKRRKHKSTKSQNCQKP